MATMYRPTGRKKYTIEWLDEHGKRHRKVASADKRASEQIMRSIETREDQKRQGLIDEKREALRDHGAAPLAGHLQSWRESMIAAGSTVKHVDLFLTRVRRVVAIVKGAALAEFDPPRGAKRSDRPRFEAALDRRVATAKLGDIDEERVQKALGVLKAAGRSLQTVNHHRAAVKAFTAWCYSTRRTGEDVLRSICTYNVKADRRHDRRTLSLGELHRLIRAAEDGPSIQGVPGPTRALIYRLAIATGLRYSEIRSIVPASFDWGAPNVTIPAAYTKNGDPATLPIPDDLADDLRPIVAALTPGAPVFSLPKEKGARMLRLDLETAEIPYQDDSGLFFDFHALRCQMATLLDAAGVSPRVIQRLMRHSSLALTDRYTRLRAVDIEAAASRLPCLKPPADLAATGTDDRPPRNTPQAEVDGSNPLW